MNRFKLHLVMHRGGPEVQSSYSTSITLAIHKIFMFPSLEKLMKTNKDLHLIKDFN